MDATKTKYYKDRERCYQKLLKEGRISEEQLAEFNAKNIKYLVENFKEYDGPKERVGIGARLDKLDKRVCVALNSINYDYVKIFFIMLTVFYLIYKIADIHYNHELAKMNCYDTVIKICLFPDNIFERTDTFSKKIERSIPYKVKAFHNKLKYDLYKAYISVKRKFMNFFVYVKESFLQKEKVKERPKGEVKRE